MNENGIGQKYGVIITTFGFVVSIGLLSCTASWDEIVDEAGRNAHDVDHFVMQEGELDKDNDDKAAAVVTTKDADGNGASDGDDNDTKEAHV
jgi:hypothetical protein